jgi:hypothetical protein
LADEFVDLVDAPGLEGVVDGGEEQLLGGEGVVGFVLDELFQSGGDVGDAKGPELVLIDAGEHHFPSSSRA